jgi:L-malate glycosyltransferase
MLTVLLATRNRARILQDVLESFCRLQEPPSGWKLVLVDNGSVDRTAEVVASFVNRLPLHCATEPKPGKNFALNTGLELVEGDLTVLTDDDVFPYPDWLVELRKAADAQPTHSMFGGTVVPRWEAPPPRWIECLDTRPLYSLSSPSLKEGPIHSSLIFGPNMAIRTPIFQSGLRFNPTIGPLGASYAMGSETELTLRLEQQGHTAWHAPSAVVEHFIREAQMKKAWVMQRAIRFGRGQYRLRCAQEDMPRKRWMGMPKYLLREIYQEGVLMSKAWVSFRQEDFIRSRWRFNFLRGEAIEARILVRERRGRAQSIPSKV